MHNNEDWYKIGTYLENVRGGNPLFFLISGTLIKRSGGEENGHNHQK
jgi:hypothetical protein